jgi:hypothetical protein
MRAPRAKVSIMEPLGNILSNPLAGLFLGLILGALAVSGKFSLVAADILLVLAGVVGSFGIYNARLSDWRLTTSGSLTLIVLCLLVSWWIEPNKPAEVATKDQPSIALTLKKPSLLFVFGAPLGDNRSATWLMMALHYGPEPAHNCDLIFYDDDRKNIEHLWRVEHGSPPFSPPGQFEESQKRLFVAEAGAEGGTKQAFNWTPLNPNSQHYTVTIGCRAGYFVEQWEVTRVNNILRAKITIEHGPEWVSKHPNENPLVFKYEDPEFVSAPLATAIPSQRLGVIAHPGWKPNYRFEVPVAIIDPDGNLQIASGVTQPDGDTRTDFGSWNILTKHFGD